MKRIILLLGILVLLTGCTLVPNEYRSVKPHVAEQQQEMPKAVEVGNSAELKKAILGFIKAGREKATIRAVQYDGNVEEELVQAVYDIVRQTPVGAYAVDYLNHTCVKIIHYYEIRLDITYRRTAAEIAAIQQAYSPEQLRDQVERALMTWDDHLALQVTRDQEYDIAAIVQDYCAANPDTMVEIPGVTVTVYPETGTEKIVDVEFLYTHTAEELSVMKKAVEESVFAAAEYIRYRSADRDKTTLLYTYLTQRFSYKEGTTATPVYSALCEGIADPVGLARGFALICRRANVQCHAVNGLLDGKDHSWNIVSDDGDFRHVDLARCILEKSGLRLLTDWDMGRYYWNRAGFPACVVVEPAVPQEGPIEEEQTEEPQEPADSEEEQAPVEEEAV